jgi:hypothetical protein
VRRLHSDLPLALVAAGAAALTALVNVPRALGYSFWQDEVGAARVITDPGPISMLRRLVGTENHPPGFYALGWLLDRLGVPVVWDRTISVLAAMALSGLVVLYARRLVPLWGAALAGLVTALGWQFWRHGWELRPYSVFALACLLFIFALVWATESPTRRRLALLAAAVAAGTMTHFFFVFTLCAGLIWLYVRKRDLRRLLIAIAVGLLPLVAWLPAFYKQFDRGAFRNPDFSLRTTLESYAALFVRGDLNLLVGLLVLGLVLAGCVRLWRLSDEGRLCALAALVPVVASSLIWLAGPDVYIVKNVIGAAPFAAVAVAAALTVLPRPMSLAAAAAAAALLIASYVDTRGRIIPDYDLVAEALVDQGWQEGDPILVFGPTYQLLHPLDWYLPGGRLEIADWNGRACAGVYVISVGGRGRALTDGIETQRVRRIVIGRIPYRPELAGEARRRDGRLLATRASSCARVA